VVLVADVPIDELETVVIEYQCRSSVLLAKVLARFYWKKQFQWENTCNDFQNVSIGGKTAGVVIGDRVFEIENRFRFVYDLSEEWQKFTGLPFVFAVWAANKKIAPAFENEFNSALELGLKALNTICKTEQANYPGVDIAGYFDQNISFELDQQKRDGMKRFLELARKLEPAVLGK